MHPEIGPKGVQDFQNSLAMHAALAQNDPQKVIAAAKQIPDYIYSWFRYPRGWAHFATKDYARAENDFRTVLLVERILSNFNQSRRRTPLYSALAHFYLGQIYDATGKKDQAVNEYQEFLSHFENSKAQLPQIAVARAALQRFMQ